MNRSKKKAQAAEIKLEEDFEANLQSSQHSTSTKKRKGKNKEVPSQEIHDTQDTVTTAISAESKKKSSKKAEKEDKKKSKKDKKSNENVQEETIELEKSQKKKRKKSKTEKLNPIEAALEPVKFIMPEQSTIIPKEVTPKKEIINQEEILIVKEEEHERTMEILATKDDQTIGEKFFPSVIDKLEKAKEEEEGSVEEPKIMEEEFELEEMNDNEGVDAEEWKKIHEAFLDDQPKEELFRTLNRLYKDQKLGKLSGILESEITKADKVKDFMKKLNKLQVECLRQGHMVSDDQKLSYEKLVEVIVDAERCKIPLKEELKELLKCESRYKLIMERFQKMISPDEKATLTDFTSLQEHMRKFPINMSREYQRIEEIVTEGKQLESEVKKWIDSDFKGMEILAKRSKECLAYIEPLSKIERKYGEVKKDYEKIKKKQAEINGESGGKDIGYDELTELEMIIDMLETYNLDPSFKKLRKKIFIMRCGLLKTELTSPSGLTVSFVGLKSLLLGLVNLRKQWKDDDELASAGVFIENLFKDAEKKVAEIEKEASLERLANMSKIVLGFVDLSREIIEKQASLTAAAVKVEKQDLYYVYPSPVVERKKEPEKIEKEKSKTPRKKKTVTIRVDEKRKDSVRKKPKESSKEKSREREKSISRMKRKESIQKESKSWVRGQKENERVNKITTYFGTRKPSTPTLDVFISKKKTLSSNPVLVGLKNELEQSGDMIALSYFECSEFAKKIAQAFPEILRVKEEYLKIRMKLRNVLKYRYIARSLKKKEFERWHLKNLFLKDATELKAMERKLAAQAKEDAYFRNIKKYSDEDDILPMTIKKKVKQFPPPQFAHHRTSSRQLSPPYQNKRERERPRNSPSHSKSKRAPAAVGIDVVKNENDIEDYAISKKSKGVGGKDSVTSKRSATGIVPKTFLEDVKFDLGKRSTDSKKSSVSKHYNILYDPLEDKKKSPHIVKSREATPNQKEYKVHKVKSNQGSSFDNSYQNVAAGFDSLAEFEIPIIEPSKPKKKSEEKKVNQPQYDKGSIFRICEGILEYGVESRCPKMGLYTCDDYEKIIQIPILIKEDQEKEDQILNITQNVSKANGEGYLEKIFGRTNHQNVRIISGWMEFKISLYQSRCDQIAQDLLETDQMRTLSFDRGSSRMIFMHKDQMQKEWREKLNFKAKRLQKGSDPKLYFIIIAKLYKARDDTKFIVPIYEPDVEGSVIRGGEEDLSMTSLEERLKDDQKSDPSSIEDYEPNFGVEVEPGPVIEGMKGVEENFKRNDEEGRETNPQAVLGMMSPVSGYEEEIIEERKDQLERNPIIVKEEEGGNLGKRSYEEMNPKANDEGELETSYDKKKLKTENNEKIIQELEIMKEKDVFKFAKSLEPDDRKQIMNHLKAMNEANLLATTSPIRPSQSPTFKTTTMTNKTKISEEKEDEDIQQQEQDEEVELLYKPPDFIKGIYQLFTQDLANQAKLIRTSADELEAQEPKNPKQSYRPLKVSPFNQGGRSFLTEIMNKRAQANNIYKDNQENLRSSWIQPQACILEKPKIRLLNTNVLGSSKPSGPINQAQNQQSIVIEDSQGEQMDNTPVKLTPLEKELKENTLMNNTKNTVNKVITGLFGPKRAQPPNQRPQVMSTIPVRSETQKTSPINTNHQPQKLFGQVRLLGANPPSLAQKIGNVSPKPQLSKVVISSHVEKEDTIMIIEEEKKENEAKGSEDKEKIDLFDGQISMNKGQLQEILAPLLLGAIKVNEEKMQNKKSVGQKAEYASSSLIKRPLVVNNGPANFSSQEKKSNVRIIQNKAQIPQPAKGNLVKVNGSAEVAGKSEVKKRFFQK